MNSPKNTQEAYERIHAWFSRPGATLGRPTRQDDRFGEAGCVYRGERNSRSQTRCAVGCLIPDDLYDENIEGSRVDILFDENAIIRLDLQAYFRRVSEDFLMDAQRQHDNHATSPLDFLQLLDKTALKHGLKLVTP